MNSAKARVRRGRSARDVERHDGPGAGRFSQNRNSSWTRAVETTSLAEKASMKTIRRDPSPIWGSRWCRSLAAISCRMPSTVSAQRPACRPMALTIDRFSSNTEGSAASPRRAPLVEDKQMREPAASQRFKQGIKGCWASPARQLRGSCRSRPAPRGPANGP